MARRTTRPHTAIGQLERLEGRALMAADVTASLSNGVLAITGTDRSDSVTIGIDSRGTAFVATPAKGTLATFPSFGIRAITASLGNGADRINIHLPSRNLEAVTVDMGGGSAESCRVCVGSIGDLNIDGRAAVGTSVLVTNTVVQKSARLDFGEGAGNDTADIERCNMNRLWASLGADNDAFRVWGSSSISSIDVSMGSGRDFCSVSRGSEIRSGKIDGGSNLPGFNFADVVTRPADMQGVRFINFERVSNAG